MSSRLYLRLNGEDIADMIPHEMSETESTLRLWIPAALRGEEQALPAIRKSLHAIRPGYESTLPLLIVLLDSPFDDIRGAAATAIGSLKGGSSSAVSALEELLHAQRGPSSHEAARALGDIHTEGALRSLVGELTHLQSEYCLTALSQIERFGEEAEEALPQLEKFLRRSKNLDQRVSIALGQCVKTIIQEIKREAANKLDQADLPAAMRILSWHRGNQKPEEFFSQYREEVPRHGGPLLERRLRFVTNQVNECAVAIHRGVRGQEVIVATNDRQSYGVIPSEFAADLATALMHTYTLNPYNLKFFAYTPAFSHFMHGAECKQIFLSFDADRREFRKVREERVKDLRAELREIGIEL